MICRPQSWLYTYPLDYYVREENFRGKISRFFSRYGWINIIIIIIFQMITMMKMICRRMMRWNMKDNFWHAHHYMPDILYIHTCTYFCKVEHELHRLNEMTQVIGASHETDGKIKILLQFLLLRFIYSIISYIIIIIKCKNIEKRYICTYFYYQSRYLYRTQYLVEKKG